MKKTFLPEEFREKYSRLLGKDYAKFIEFCAIKMPKSIWANSLKITPRELQEQLEKKGVRAENMEFHENAFAVGDTERPGSLEEFREGLFNVQEKASMLPAVVLKPEGCERVLDMAAAPGGKTLQLATLMKGSGRILAVDRDFRRFRSLTFNVRKFGLTSLVKAVRADALRMEKEDYFDAVLLDAPCSSEGLVRKRRDALKNWSQRLVERKAKLQKRLIIKGFDSLKEGGAMVYSTCSLSPEENEEVVSHLLGKRRCEAENVKVRGFRLRKGIDGPGNRVLPQDNDSQAFYFCRIKKG
jgi:NOL1/NOP2/sun family putative RNA methylase